MNSGEAARDGDAPREREAGLGAAILRISASLDVDTVLREVVDSARALTGARYGVIATVDDAGQPRDFFASGFTVAWMECRPNPPDYMKKKTKFPFV